MLLDQNKRAKFHAYVKESDFWEGSCGTVNSLSNIVGKSYAAILLQTQLSTYFHLPASCEGFNKNIQFEVSKDPSKDSQSENKEE